MKKILLATFLALFLIGLVSGIDVDNVSFNNFTKSNITYKNGHYYNQLNSNFTAYLGFDGDDYVSMRDHDDFSPYPNKSMSISVWLKIADNQGGIDDDGRKTIFEKGGQTGNFEYRLWRTNSTYGQDIRFAIYDSTGTSVSEMNLLDNYELDKWYNVIVTFDYSGDTDYVMGYINGNYSNRVEEDNLNINGIGDFKVGATAVSDTEKFNGTIDDLKVYSGVFDSADVYNIWRNDPRGRNETPLFSFMYHQIDPTGNANNRQTPSQLREQLQFLQDNGFESITDKEWYNYTYGLGTIPDKPFIAIWDDGDHSVYDYALDIYKDFGWGAVTAVNTKWTTYGEENDPVYGSYYMNWSQVNELIDNGWSIASHSHDHDKFSEMTYAERDGNMSLSKQLIIENTGTTPVSMIFPFNDPFIFGNFASEQNRTEIIQNCTSYYDFCFGETRAFNNHRYIFNSTNKSSIEGEYYRIEVKNITTLEDFEYLLVDYDHRLLHSWDGEGQEYGDWQDKKGNLWGELSSDDMWTNITGRRNMWDYLQGYWNFDNPNNGTNVTDLSGWGNNGSYIGGANAVEGIFGNALNSSGSSDYVTFADPSDNSLDFGTNDFSYSLWAKFDGLTASTQYIINKQTGTAIRYYLTRTSGEQLRALIQDDSSNSAYFTTTSTITDTDWHHIVVTINRSDSEGIKIYVDNVSLAGTYTNDLTAVGNINTNNPLKIGEYAGDIDEVMFFNDYILTTQDISELYGNQTNRWKNGSLSIDINHVFGIESLNVSNTLTSYLFDGNFTIKTNYSDEEQVSSVNNLQNSQSENDFNLIYNFKTDSFYPIIVSETETEFDFFGDFTWVDSCQLINSPGNYVLSQDITPTEATEAFGACIYINGENITFDGNGYSIINTTYDGKGFIIDDSDNITVENTIVHVYDGGSGYTFDITESSNIVLNNITDLGSRINIRYRSNTNNVLIANSTFLDAELYGFYVTQDVTNLTVDNNIFTGSAQHLFWAQDITGENIVIKNNIFNSTESTSSKDSIHIYGTGLNKIQVYGNSFDTPNYNDGNAIDLEGVINASIYNNVIVNSQQNVIEISNGYLSENISIYGNNITCTNNDDGTHGILVKNTTGISMYDNIVTKCNFALLFHHETEDGYAYNNTVISSGIGFYVIDESYNHRIENITIINSSDGLVFYRYNDRGNLPPQNVTAKRIWINSTIAGSDGIGFSNISNNNLTIQDSTIEVVNNAIYGAAESTGGKLINVSYSAPESFAAGNSFLRQWYATLSSSPSGATFNISNSTDDVYYGSADKIVLTGYENDGGTQINQTYNISATSSGKTLTESNQILTTNTLFSFSFSDNIEPSGSYGGGSSSSEEDDEETETPDNITIINYIERGVDDVKNLTDAIYDNLDDETKETIDKTRDETANFLLDFEGFIQRNMWIVIVILIALILFAIKPKNVNYESRVRRRR